MVDGGGVILDAAATIVPYVPGGASTAIKSFRATKVIRNEVGTTAKTTNTAKATIGAAAKNRKASIANGVPKSQIGRKCKAKRKTAFLNT